MIDSPLPSASTSRTVAASSSFRVTGPPRAGCRRSPPIGLQPVAPSSQPGTDELAQYPVPAGDSPAEEAGLGRATRPMGRADQAELAWSLATEAAGLLTRSERAWICVKLGVGDYPQVIEELLSTIAVKDMPLPGELADSARDWVFGFSGTPAEPRLRSLVGMVSPPQYPAV